MKILGMKVVWWAGKKDLIRTFITTWIGFGLAGMISMITGIIYTNTWWSQVFIFVFGIIYSFILYKKSFEVVK